MAVFVIYYRYDQSRRVVSMAKRNVLGEIKRDLDGFVGKEVRLKADRGRKKIIEKEGVLEQTYPRVFVVKVDEERSSRRLSFSYADILTETVEVKSGDVKIGSVDV